MVEIPRGSGDPNILADADPDPGSQNLADPTDPDPKHCPQHPTPSHYKNFDEKTKQRFSPHFYLLNLFGYK